MYNPARFKSEDLDEMFELMYKNPFATLITVVNGEPMISQLPLTPQRVDQKFEVIGHLARANPHWKYLNSSKSTVIFHGPHTYITPIWYTQNDVPTWNYMTVYGIGKVELIESTEGIIECLKVLTQQSESIWPSGWDFYIPEDLTNEKLSKDIVGFRMQIESLSFKKKLSQNRSSEDREGVINGLKTRKDDQSQMIRKEMLNLNFTKI